MQNDECRMMNDYNGFTDDFKFMPEGHTSILHFEFCIPRIIHKGCGMWKDELWKTAKAKLSPQGLWKDVNSCTMACG